ncbi:DUF4336 domain-containing protein [Photobacterium lutimaris]|uniref:Methanol oxidase n=1 Tax=Photobacterium lutimaris TaxID=388278 RepID=A0A2T3J2X3_9GAMM|nr:DUF4336 domain-containing protein [Photobacterium lutimaris]PSU35603.1 methanol oxidase [Photobacterium lutimaris]TDR78655.1 uncharacterized protein DUF4336 [Photobacterium lutimaris]
MRQIGDDIWVHEDSMKMLGTKLGLRMTVIRLQDGRLWVHSPTAISPSLQQAVNELGPVGYLVAANNHHSKWLQDWIEVYPDAEVYVSAGIPRKVPLSNYHILQSGMENVWQDDLEWLTMPSVPMFNETVFYHSRSNSLIVTDLVQNYPENPNKAGFAGAMTKYIFEPIGFKGFCVAPPLKMGFTLKDKPAFSRFLQSVQDWDFTQIIVTHGDIIEKEAKAKFASLSSRFVS